MKNWQLFALIGAIVFAGHMASRPKLDIPEPPSAARQFAEQAKEAVERQRLYDREYSDRLPKCVSDNGVMTCTHPSE